MCFSTKPLWNVHSFFGTKISCENSAKQRSFHGNYNFSFPKILLLKICPRKISLKNFAPEKFYRQRRRREKIRQRLRIAYTASNKFLSRNSQFSDNIINFHFVILSEHRLKGFKGLTSPKSQICGQQISSTNKKAAHRR